MLNVLVTMRFDQGQLDRLRAVSPEIAVSQADPAAADYAQDRRPLRGRAAAGSLAGSRGSAGCSCTWPGSTRSPTIRSTRRPRSRSTTTSGVHAATIAEYAVTMLLALAHRVPRMVEWQRRGGWPPDERRWQLFVPAEVRGATLGIIGYGSIGRELARIAKAAFAMRVLA